MTIFFVLAAGLGIVALIIIGCALFITYDGKGDRASGERSFRKTVAPKISLRRRLVLHWQLHLDRSQNLRLRLAAGEHLSEAWERRYAPPADGDLIPLPVNPYTATQWRRGPDGYLATFTSLPSPAPSGDFCGESNGRAGEPDTLDGLIVTPNQAAGYWTARPTRAQIEAVLPQAVIDGLGGHSSVDSCIRSIFGEQAVSA